MAQHRDEDLGSPDFPSGGVDHLHPVTTEVDEHPVAGGVAEAHDDVLGTEPGLVVTAVLGVTPAVGVVLAPLQPQQPEGHVAAALQLPVDLAPVRHGPAGGALGALGREQLGLQGLVVQVGRERPGQAGGAGPYQVLVHRRAGGPGAGRDLTGAHAGCFQPEDFTYLPHG